MALELKVPIGEYDELVPGRVYKQVYSLQLPGPLERDWIANAIGRLTAGIRNMSGAIEVVSWDVRQMKAGDTDYELSLYIVPQRATVQPAAVGAVVLTPFIVKGIIAAAIGVLGIIGLTLVYKTTYVVVQATHVFEVLAFPLVLGATAFLAKALSQSKGGNG